MKKEEQGKSGNKNRRKKVLSTEYVRNFEGKSPEEDEQEEDGEGHGNSGGQGKGAEEEGPNGGMAHWMTGQRGVSHRGGDGSDRVWQYKVDEHRCLHKYYNVLQCTSHASTYQPLQ